MAPFGFIDDGLTDYESVDTEGNVWYIAEDGTGKFVDSGSEYGELNYMWEYR